MQTSSSSNESRSSAKKVVTSYSNCALAQKPVYPGQKKKADSKPMITSITSSGKSSISPLSEGESGGKVCDYFDDEIDDQPDLTLYENDSIKGMTPASEFPPSNFALVAQGVKKGGGESDARDLASELFLAGKTPEEENMKDSSLNGSLESLEHDQQQQDR